MKISGIHIEPDGDGGHMVHVHFQQEPAKGKMPMYRESDSKAFGQSEGHDMLAHVANALKIPEMSGAKLTPESADKIRAKANGR